QLVEVDAGGERGEPGPSPVVAALGEDLLGLVERRDRHDVGEIGADRAQDVVQLGVHRVDGVVDLGEGRGQVETLEQLDAAHLDPAQAGRDVGRRVGERVGRLGRDGDLGAVELQ